MQVWTQLGSVPLKEYQLWQTHFHRKVMVIHKGSRWGLRSIQNREEWQQKLVKLRDNKKPLLFFNLMFIRHLKTWAIKHTNLTLNPKYLLKRARTKKTNFRGWSVFTCMLLLVILSREVPVSLLEHKYRSSWTQTRHRSQQVYDTVNWVKFLQKRDLSLQPLSTAPTCPNHRVTGILLSLLSSMIRVFDVESVGTCQRQEKNHQVWSNEKVPVAPVSGQNGIWKGCVHRGANGHVPKAEYLDIKTIIYSSFPQTVNRIWIDWICKDTKNATLRGSF